MDHDDRLIEGVDGISRSIDGLRASNEEESRRRRSDTRRHAVDPDVLTFRIAAFGTVVGGLMGIFGTLLGVLIEHHLLS